MISDEEIRVWWQRKINNYTKKYACRNKLSLAQAKEKYFTETHENIPREHSTSNPKIIAKLFMIQEQHRQLMNMLWNGERTNLSKWVEQLVNNFWEEQAIDERASLDNIKSQFHNNFHEIFICTIPALLFIFLIDKCVAHIFEPQPPLVEWRSNNDRKNIRQWEKFIGNQEWKQFFEEWTPSSTQNKPGQWWGVDIEPSSQNDYVKPLVDENIENLPEQKQDEVPYWYPENRKRKESEEAWRNAWDCKSVKKKKKMKEHIPTKPKDLLESRENRPIERKGEVLSKNSTNTPKYLSKLRENRSEERKDEASSGLSMVGVAQIKMMTS